MKDGYQEIKSSTQNKELINKKYPKKIYVKPKNISDGV